VSKLNKQGRKAPKRRKST